MPISADDDDDVDDDDGGGDDDDYDVGVVGGGDTAGISFTAQRFSLTAELCNLFGKRSKKSKFCTSATQLEVLVLLVVEKPSRLFSAGPI